MAADKSTLDFYTAEACAYADRAAGHATEAPLGEFAAALPPGGDVLDFGCGPGWAAAHFKDLGFAVTAIDGSPGLAAQARARYGLVVTVMQFDVFEARAAFDGIWASFCLLHDSRAAMPGHLSRLHRSLRTDGLLYLGLKEGTGERRDDLGRLYTYFGKQEITDLLMHAGFGLPRIRAFESLGLEGSVEPCLHIFANRA